MYKNVDFFLFFKRFSLRDNLFRGTLSKYMNILHCFIVNAKKTPAVDIIKICNQHE